MQSYSRSYQFMQDFQKCLMGGETTHQQLLDALRSTKIGFKPLPGFDPNRDELQYYRMQQDIDCDEVYPNVFIGNGITAANKVYLKMLRISHVLNAAEGFVHTNSNYYRYSQIQYLGLPMADLPSTDISRYFFTAANFIQDAVSSGGKVYVHCVQGVSRSATCVIAYLMIKKGMLAADAIRCVRRSRDIFPNEGFLRQLARLDNQLRRQRL